MGGPSQFQRPPAQHIWASPHPRSCSGHLVPLHGLRTHDSSVMVTFPTRFFPLHGEVVSGWGGGGWVRSWCHLPGAAAEVGSAVPRVRGSCREQAPSAQKVADGGSQKALPFAARIPLPQATPRSPEYLPVEHDRGPVVITLLQDKDDVPGLDMELLWCLGHKPEQHTVRLPFQGPEG